MKERLAPLARLTPTASLMWALTFLIITFGAVLRAWILFHRPIGSDEAIVGLMARQILHGHFSALYWGQTYGGAEPYVVAGVFAAFGSSIWALEGTAVLLSAASAILTWRVVLRLVDVPALAILSGALVWAVPVTVLSNSTLEYGFRGVTMLSGLVLLLLGLRILDGHRRVAECALRALHLSGVGKLDTCCWVPTPEGTATSCGDWLNGEPVVWIRST